MIAIAFVVSVSTAIVGSIGGLNCHAAGENAAYDEQARNDCFHVLLLECVEQRIDTPAPYTMTIALSVLI